MWKKEEFLHKLNQIGIGRLLLLLAAGIVLLVLSVPTRSTKEAKIGESTGNTAAVEIDSNDSYRIKMENQLKTALMKVNGIGKAEVMITLKGTGEVVVNKDAPSTEEMVSEEDSSGGKRKTENISKGEETILVTDENGKNIPYVIKQNEPEVAGVVVICEGGGNETVISDITDACEVLFSVPVHRIKVMKMKENP